MPEHSADTFAEVQPQPARFHVGPAVAAGVSLVEDPGQVLRGYAYSGVGDLQHAVFAGYGNSAGAGVFHRVGKHLPDNEQQPLFVGQHRAVKPAHFQREFLPDELPGESPHRSPDYILKAVLLYHKVGVAFQPDVAQHHLDVLLDTGQFLGERPAFRGILLRQGQPHCRYGGLYLVRPHGVVVGHVGDALLIVRLHFGAAAEQRPCQLRVAFLDGVLRFGEVVG